MVSPDVNTSVGKDVVTFTWLRLCEILLTWGLKHDPTFGQQIPTKGWTNRNLMPLIQSSFKVFSLCCFREIFIQFNSKETYTVEAKTRS